MNNMTICAVQHDIAWEDPQTNFLEIDKLLDKQVVNSDIILLPEFFAVGFTPLIDQMAEQEDGPTLHWMKSTAADKQAIVAGTVPTITQRGVVNRFWWVHPSGQTAHYDKYHLFGVGGETDHLVPGDARPLITAHGWTFMPQVCYDLRFPVFARNAFADTKFAYDVLVYTANWPAARSHHWRSLLVSRAIENQCYVIGVNRTGTDGNGLLHQGDTLVIDFQGSLVAAAIGNQPQLVESTLNMENLNRWRERFPVASDWDQGPLPQRVTTVLG